MSIRRVLLATAATAAGLVALPSGSASAAPVFDCVPTWPTAPVRCFLAEQEDAIREDPPVLECGPTFEIGPIECAAERAVKDALDTVPSV
jgi:hypothetical protein